MLAAELTRAGFLARRGVQYQGSSDSPDIICPELAHWHWEAKFTEKCRLCDWLNQVETDRNGKPYIIAWRRRRGPWIALLGLSALLELIRASLQQTAVAPAARNNLTSQPTPRTVDLVAGP
jgi:hypothetical protein